MKGKFFAVGVGPGDPELMTLKSIKVIRESDLIAVPGSGKERNFAFEIAKEHISDKDIMWCDMPMTKDEKKLNEFHDIVSERISGKLEEGKDVAFLTIGDPAVYSTVMYVHSRLKKRGYSTAMIPGVSSFCGAAASADIPLCLRDGMLHIIPATFKGHLVEGLPGTKVLMKPGLELLEAKEELAKENAILVERATMEEEKICRDIAVIEENPGYFSLVIIPEGEE